MFVVRRRCYFNIIAMLIHKSTLNIAKIETKMFSPHSNTVMYYFDIILFWANIKMAILEVFCLDLTISLLLGARTKPFLLQSLFYFLDFTFLKHLLPFSFFQTSKEKFFWLLSKYLSFLNGKRYGKTYTECLKIFFFRWELPRLPILGFSITYVVSTNIYK